MIEITTLRPVAIAAVALSITFLFAAKYIAAGVWILFALTIFLVEKVGIDNMTSLNRAEAILAWIFLLSFISLSIFQVVKDFARN
jgi:hypothetical protein